MHFPKDWNLLQGYSFELLNDINSCNLITFCKFSLHTCIIMIKIKEGHSLRGTGNKKSTTPSIPATKIPEQYHVKQYL